MADTRSEVPTAACASPAPPPSKPPHSRYNGGERRAYAKPALLRSRRDHEIAEAGCALLGMMGLTHAVPHERLVDHGLNVAVIYPDIDLPTGRPAWRAVPEIGFDAAGLAKRLAYRASQPIQPPAAIAQPMRGM